MCNDKDFVHLHLHTEYSLLDGFARIEKAVNYAKSLGMGSLAITDHGTMFGVMDFYRACKKAEIKPIVGLESYLARRTRFDRDPQQDNQPYHMLLLAKNMTGYKNLLKMASVAQLEGYYYRPRIDWDLMAECSEGIIATSGCLAAEIPRMVEAGREEDAKRLIGKYQDTFGKDNFFLELQSHDIPELNRLNNWLLANKDFADVKLVATNDVHYVRLEDYDNHDTLLCIQTSSLKNDPKRMRMTDNSYHLRTQEEMWRIFGDVAPDALRNTLLIAEMCNLNLDDKKYHLPVFPVPPQFKDAGDYLRYLCFEGLEWRYGESARDPKVRERLDYELSVINKMGFDTYFLIVWDLCEFARHADIWWNVRGSGAGSVVAYTLGITGLDPLENNLLFERFLNPGRVSMPDFDLDYPEDRRAEMIEYCTRKYGEDKVAAIITFGTLGAKAAIKDVGRALEIPLSDVDRITRTIPTAAKIPKIPDLIGEDPEKAVPDLKALYSSDPTAKKIIDIAAAIEGVPRHASTHAAGVIVADRPLVEYLPLHRPTKGDGEDNPVKMVTQFPMETAESIGLLKIDFLGLSTLTILRRACEMIEKYHGIHFDMENIPFRPVPNDPETSRKVAEAFQMMSNGDTVGVFQLESSGMRQTLVQVRPSTFEHIIAVISLYRPGPMDFIPLYARRMHGQEETVYHHPLLEPILNNTFGIMVYQEQLMQIGSELFSYSLGEADLMRRAVSKKKAKDLAEHRQTFMDRGPEKGVDPDTASKIFDDIEFFANYGFNKCTVSNTLLCNPLTGKLVTIGDLYSGKASITKTLTLHTGSRRLRNGTISAVMENGTKPVYRLTTQSGREITATDNHPFYTQQGWQMLGTLTIGQPIAVPAVISVEGKQVWAEQDLIALANHLIEQPDQLPDEVFELTNSQITTLLSYLESANGKFSAKMARQIQHLLLRQSILSCLKETASGYAVQAVENALIDRDIYWDAVASIEYVGEEMTYDLTIEDTHNFVANDIIVHNSHAADYAVITCKSAYLKCHYPHEYMSALMSVYFDVSEKVSLFVADCRHRGIKVLPPDVNKSYSDFSIEEWRDGTRHIRFGLGAVKNLGLGAIEYLLNCRGEQPFADLDDFLKRCDMREVGKRGLEALIQVGALDQFMEKGQRAFMRANLEKMMSYSGEYHKNASTGQVSMFDLLGSTVFDAGSIASAMTEQPPKNWDLREILRWEKELVGLYVSDHPLNTLWAQLEHTITHTTAMLLEEAENLKDTPVTIAGLVSSIRTVTTKKGDPMAIIVVEDIHGTVECVLFPKLWEKVRDQLELDKVFVFRGRADLRGTDVNIKLDSVSSDFTITAAIDQPMFATRLAEAHLDLGLEVDEETGEAIKEMPEPSIPAAERVIAPASAGATINTQRLEPQLTSVSVGIMPEEPEDFRMAMDRWEEPKDTAPVADEWMGLDVPRRAPMKTEPLIDKNTGKLKAPPAPAAVPRVTRKKLVIEMQRTEDAALDRRRLRLLHNSVKEYPGSDEFCIIVHQPDGKRLKMDFPALKIKIHDKLMKELEQREGVKRVYVET